MTDHLILLELIDDNPYQTRQTYDSGEHCRAGGRHLCPGPAAAAGGPPGGRRAGAVGVRASPAAGLSPHPHADRCDGLERHAGQRADADR